MQHSFSTYKIKAHLCPATKTNYPTKRFTLNLTKMNKLFSLALLTILFASCDKEDVPNPQPPSMRYTDLENFEIKAGTYKRIDLDGDGRNDVLFNTLNLGDALGQRVRLQFYANTTIDTYQPVNEHEESPILAKDAAIALQFPQFTWYDITAVVLAEKVILTPSEETYWDGLWKNASHQYLPVQVKKGGQAFLGWIEMSFDKEAEKLILHKAALSTIANKEIKAGE
jgi:hypothetical protein